eukprot:14608917-Heterocapsa_arctica.AAC.1
MIGVGTSPTINTLVGQCPNKLCPNKVRFSPKRFVNNATRIGLWKILHDQSTSGGLFLPSQ